MPTSSIILLAPPQQLGRARGYDAAVGVMGYRLHTGGALLRSPKIQGSGGWLTVDDAGFDGSAPVDAGRFLRDVLRECGICRYTGVIANWDGPVSTGLQAVTRKLDQGLAERSIPLLVPERWAVDAPHAQVLISSALSGGSLKERLEEAQKRWGNERAALAVERSAEEFLLPAPVGGGLPLTQAELKRRQERYRPTVFFSAELCAHYFTWQSQDGRAHFVLFDNESSVRKKLHLARSLDIAPLLLAFPEVEEWLPGVLH